MDDFDKISEPGYSVWVILAVTALLAFVVLIASMAGIAPGCSYKVSGECPILDSTTSTVRVETSGHAGQ